MMYNREVKHYIYGFTANSNWQTVHSCVPQKYVKFMFFNLSHSFEKLLDISS